MERIEALKALVKKVEAGSARASDFGPCFPSGIDSPYYMARNSYNGSRDAAKELRFTCFEGWHVIIWGHDEYCVTLQDPKNRIVKHTAKGRCEARAELLAILKGLIAQEANATNQTP